jgi:hypothetical protein
MRAGHVTEGEVVRRVEAQEDRRFRVWRQRRVLYTVRDGELVERDCMLFEVNLRSVIIKL